MLLQHHTQKEDIAVLDIKDIHRHATVCIYTYIYHLANIYKHFNLV